MVLRHRDELEENDGSIPYRKTEIKFLILNGSKHLILNLIWMDSNFGQCFLTIFLIKILFIILKPKFNKYEGHINLYYS